MKFQCEKSALAAAVQTVSRAVNARVSLPILSHILFTAENGRVQVAASDLETTLRSDLAASVEVEGSTTLPARLLNEVVAELPDGPVKMSDVGGLTSFEGRQARFKMNSMPADEYPELPAVPAELPTQLPQKLIRQALRLVAVGSASSEETRAVLQGVHMTLQDTHATFVATDGRRLAKLELTLPVPIDPAQTAILPARAVAELQRLLKDTDEPVKMAFRAGQMVCDVGGASICTRLLEGKYPNYRNLLPTSFQTTALLDRELFAASIRRLLVMAQEKQTPHLVRLNMTGDVLEMSSNAPDLGAANDSMPLNKQGNDLEIAFNGKLLLEGLQILSGTEVRLQMNDSASPAILQPVAHTMDYLYLLMPVRLQRDESPMMAGAGAASPDSPPNFSDARQTMK